MSTQESGSEGGESLQTPPIPKPRHSIKKTTDSDSEEKLRARTFEIEVKETLKQSSQAIEKLSEELKMSVATILAKIIEIDLKRDEKIDGFASEIERLRNDVDDLKESERKRREDELNRLEEARRVAEQQRLEEQRRAEEQIRLEAERQEREQREAEQREAEQREAERQRANDVLAPDADENISPNADTETDTDERNMRRLLMNLFHSNLQTGPFIILGASAFLMYKVGGLFRSSRPSAN